MAQESEKSKCFALQTAIFQMANKHDARNFAQEMEIVRRKLHSEGREIDFPRF